MTNKQLAGQNVESQLGPVQLSESWAYLATVIDLASRKVVGWALADHMRIELISDAPLAAFEIRRRDLPLGLCRDFR